MKEPLPLRHYVYKITSLAQLHEVLKTMSADSQKRFQFFEDIFNPLTLEPFIGSMRYEPNGFHMYVVENVVNGWDWLDRNGWIEDGIEHKYVIYGKVKLSKYLIKNRSS
jgi:hypothetical protein